ncbi:AAA family ATPase [Martelella radicis]|uniref:DNA transposition protein n=1 Tax=Martelella radicis TaxID=1397476 RepID=A0A7W6PA36_9HYPH|nr:hypothetical protein [Martelella radicis]
MTKKHNANTGWVLSQPTTAFLEKHPAGDVDEWRSLVARTAETATANGWSKAEVARRSGVAEGTFSQWLSGKYTGVLAPYNTMISQWLTNVEEAADMAAAIPESPGFVKTKVATEVLQTLMWAQMTPALVAVTLDAGVGKTTACRHYCATRPHAYMATISPSTKKVHGMLVELAEALDVSEHNPARLVRAIGRKLQRVGDGTLLIIDEAQNLEAESINQLRHFVDNNNCGVALVGNEDTAASFVRQQGRSVASRAQVLSRFDKRLRREGNRADDIRLFVNALGVEDGDCIKFLLGLGLKPGALRQIDRTVKLARMYAMGEGQPLALDHLKAAWKNRDLGDLQ